MTFTVVPPAGCASSAIFGFFPKPGRQQASSRPVAAIYLESIEFITKSPDDYRKVSMHLHGQKRFSLESTTWGRAAGLWPCRGSSLKRDVLCSQSLIEATCLALRDRLSLRGIQMVLALFTSLSATGRRGRPDGRWRRRNSGRHSH